MGSSEVFGGEDCSGRLTNGKAIGLLADVIPSDVVDEVLAETGALGQRTRLLPARVVVYFVLALSLFFDDAHEEVMCKLVQGLPRCGHGGPTGTSPASALCQARRRLGERPMQRLFERVALPIAASERRVDGWPVGG